MTDNSDIKGVLLIITFKICQTHSLHFDRIKISFIAPTKAHFVYTSTVCIVPACLASSLPSSGSFTPRYSNIIDYKCNSYYATVILQPLLTICRAQTVIKIIFVKYTLQSVNSNTIMTFLLNMFTNCMWLCCSFLFVYKRLIYLQSHVMCSVYPLNWTHLSYVKSGRHSSLQVRWSAAVFQWLHEMVTTLQSSLVFRYAQGVRCGMGQWWVTQSLGFMFRSPWEFFIT